MSGLTKHQAECLGAIIQLTTAEGVTPTYDELKEHLGLASKSGVHRLITALEERGYLHRLPHCARALEVIRQPGSIGRVDAIMSLIMASDAGPFLGERVQSEIRACIARGLSQ